MDGFWESLGKWFNEKTGSPLYFTYIGFFVAWNWKVLYVLFIEHESKFSFPVIEYIEKRMYFSLENFLTWAPPVIITITNWLANLVWHILPPVLFTIIAILYFPRVQKWALQKYLDSRFERKRMFENKQREHNEWLLSFAKIQEKTLGEIAEVTERQTKKREAIKRATTKEEQWSRDYEELKSNPIFQKFNQITESIYTNSGSTSKWAPHLSRTVRSVDSDVLALAHSTGLIAISGDETREKIELTDKGKFFVSKYLSNKV